MTKDMLPNDLMCPKRETKMLMVMINLQKKKKVGEDNKLLCYVWVKPLF